MSAIAKLVSSTLLPLKTDKRHQFCAVSHLGRSRSLRLSSSDRDERDFGLVHQSLTRSSLISSSSTNRNSLLARSIVDLIVKPISRKSLGAKQQLRGSLSTADGVDPQNLDSYADDYILRGLKAGQRVEITLRSSSFDTFVRLVDARKSKSSILQGDDISRNSTNSRLVFTVKPGIKYIVRVGSYRARAIGSYALTSRTITPSASDFNFFYGYGLVDASAAVARAGNQNTFANVSNLGGSNWSLDLIKAPEAWAQGFTGQGITVAVLDSGVDYTHPDLVDNIWTNPGEIAGNGIDDDGNGFVDDVRGWDFISGDSDPLDNDSHGTHVAGTIAAARNGFGVTGVAYSAKIMPIRVIPDGAVSTAADFARVDANIAAGIRYAVQNGARVINMSLGNYPGAPSLPQTEEALRFAEAEGVIAVSAAGNERQSYGAIHPDEPAFYAASSGLAIGSVDIGRALEIDSNPAGEKRLNFVVAPGVEILSTVPDGGYEYKTGTSMAAPHTAGVVALMLSANPSLTPAQIKTILTATANRRGITQTP